MILSERKVVMKKLVSCLLIVCSCVMFVTAASPVYSKEAPPEYNSVLRFHIRANSDSEEDQRIKLAVRDEVVKLAGVITKDCQTVKEARAALSEKADMITNLADSVLDRNGVDYKSQISFVTERFPEKTYGGVLFPEGIYNAVRVDLGRAEGHNFWCVLFPPICLADACTEQVLDKYGVDDFSKKDEAPRFVIKFKLWEDIKKIFAR